jgi:hypothetical protein
MCALMMKGELISVEILTVMKGIPVDVDDPAQ